MKQGRHEEFREICERNGWRCTRQRLVVYSFMQGNRTHPGVDAVWEKAKKEIPGMTRESVFRILCEFADKGIIARLDSLPAARFDSETRPHGHFICAKCGKVFDFELPENISIPLPIPGAKIAGMEIRFTGLCEKDAKAG